MLKRLKSSFNPSRLASAILAITFSAGILTAPLQTHALVNNAASAGKVSFTFDDGYTSAISQAAPTLAKYGMAATNYVVTRCVGMTTAPNTCQANNDATYMNWDQIAQLKTTYGWEIGSHTVTHPYLATSDPDDQPEPISAAQMAQEISQSKSDLAAHGIDATAFASPYGDYNNSVLAQVAKSYSSQRGFGDVGYNSWPNSDYYIKVQQVQGNISVRTVQSYVDTAIQNKQWLVLVFHDIKTRASSQNNDYEYSTSGLDQIAAYIKSKSVPVVNISHGLVTSDTNLLANPSFNNGIADGWSTDSPSTITKDTANNGSYPDPTNSIKMVSSPNETHLYSPRVSVSSSKKYLLKNFLNVKSLTSGEVGFYIDEYDANDNWISGQYKVAEPSSFVEALNFAYTPTSSAVAKAGLQVIVHGTGITAYLDNAQWFELSENVITAPTNNLMPNPKFDSGIAGGWTTDKPTVFTKDANGNGSPNDPVNSVKIVADNTNAHLFSPQILIDAASTYNIGGYIKILQRNSGEVAYYIDEYDSSGKWISGQYKTGVNVVGTTNTSFNYKATSSKVRRARLQIVVTANSGVYGYFDSVFWTLV